MNWIEFVVGIVGTLISESIIFIIQYIKSVISKRHNKQKLNSSKPDNQNSSSAIEYNSTTKQTGDVNQSTTVVGNENKITNINQSFHYKNELEPKDPSEKYNAKIDIFDSFRIGILVLIFSIMFSFYNTFETSWDFMFSIVRIFTYLNIGICINLFISFFITKSTIYKNSWCLITSIFCFLFDIAALIVCNKNIYPYTFPNKLLLVGVTALFALLFTLISRIRLKRDIKVNFLMIVCLIVAYTIIFIILNTIYK